MKEICVCMGSSCFSRGNEKNAEYIQRYVAEQHLEKEVRVAGCLCRDKCKYGPIVTADGKVHFRFRPDMLPLLLTKRDE